MTTGRIRQVEREALAETAYHAVCAPIVTHMIGARELLAVDNLAVAHEGRPLLTPVAHTCRWVRQ